MFHSGFVTIIGRPNVGKSTLLNQIVGEKVAIVSDKAQTTRTRIQGVYHFQNGQIVFVDTPGVQTPKNRLGEFMLKQTWSAFDGVEALIVMFNGAEGLRNRDMAIIEQLRGRHLPPTFGVVNQLDHAAPEQLLPTLDKLGQETIFNEIYPISALTGEGVAALTTALRCILPEGPQYFPDGVMTDQPEHQLMAELIREAALRHLREEVPHGVGVEINGTSRRDNGQLELQVTLYCEKEGHKGILIGKGGAMLKQIGSEARQEIQRLLQTPIHLELWIKVKENWRNSQATLRTLGYE